MVPWSCAYRASRRKQVTRNQATRQHDHAKIMQCYDDHKHHKMKHHSVISLFHHHFFARHNCISLDFIHLIFLRWPIQRRPAAQVILRVLRLSLAANGCVNMTQPTDCTWVGSVRSDATHAPMPPYTAAETFHVMCLYPFVAPGSPYRVSIVDPMEGGKKSPMVLSSWRPASLLLP